MASNQTSNYGLCQWEATDQVLREEFNADNQKIDEALAGIRTAAKVAGTKLLKSLVLETDTPLMNLDLSDINWAAYSCVYIGLEPILSGKGTMSVAFGSMNMGTMSSITTSSTTGPRNVGLLILYPLFSAERRAAPILVGVGEGGFKQMDIPFSSASSVFLSSDSSLTLKAGSAIRVWGAK